MTQERDNQDPFEPADGDDPRTERFPSAYPDDPMFPTRAEPQPQPERSRSLSESMRHHPSEQEPERSVSKRPWWDVDEDEEEQEVVRYKEPVRRETATTSSPSARRPAGSAPSRKSPVLIAALIFSLLLAGAAGALYLRELETSPEEVGEFLDDSSPEVAKQATTAANLLINYDSTNLEDVGQKILALSTGNFRKDYADILKGGLNDALEKASASSRGQIVEGPDVYFRSASEAIAIVRLDQTTQSTENPEGSSFEYLMKITLVETTDGGWKVDDVAILSQERADT